MNWFATHMTRILLLLLWLATQSAAYGQTDSLGGITGAFTRYQREALTEKLFLHIDRPFYNTGETMWFKIYAVDGTYNKRLPLSKVAYVEILDQEQRPVLQGKIALKHATGQSSFVLPSSLASGTYTVRAYTSWMKNFGPAYYFQRSVTILNTMVASGKAATKDSTAYTVQFFPEGGNLVQGLSSIVAFKVTDHTGRGIDAEGSIATQSGTVVATFKTLRLGMGKFVFTPMAGVTYTATVKTATGLSTQLKLPLAYAQGYVMQLKNTSGNELTIQVNSSNSQPETLSLLGHSGQQIVAAMRAQLVNGQAAFVIDKRQLLGGISHFTLFSPDHKPLCERLFFTPPANKLAIDARSNKSQYTLRDKVSLAISASAKNEELLSTDLSVAVYRLDSLNTTVGDDIRSYLALTSDLKGTVESPGYYLTATDQEAVEATDNLMLTHGWSRFRWEDILKSTPPSFAYLPEINGMLIQGRLTQPKTNVPVPGIRTYLSTPSRAVRLNNAVSNADGFVWFEMNQFPGAQELVVQTDPQQDSTCRLEILPSFSNQYATTPPSSFNVPPRFREDYSKRHFQNQIQQNFPQQANHRTTRIAFDSTAFYGKPDETYFLDKYTRFKVLEEVMREYVPGVVVRIRKDGFHFLVVDKINKELMSDNPLVLLDGVPVFNINKIMAMDPLKIQKLEVIDSRYYQGASIYNGIVSFTTYKGDLEGFQLDPRVLVQQYEGVQLQREFYTPRYDTPQAQQSRLPDLRNLLYWNPNVTTSTDKPASLDFYTGDQAGRYRVVVQGISSSGVTGSTSYTFEVSPAQ